MADYLFQSQFPTPLSVVHTEDLPQQPVWRGRGKGGESCSHAARHVRVTSAHCRGREGSSDILVSGSDCVLIETVPIAKPE